MPVPFIGEIKMFGGNFAPRGFALCDGQLIAIASNTALFSILGTTYGGDGRTSFGLPDLRGRLPMHAGSGPGLSPRSLGDKFGLEQNTLNLLTMPAHNHIINSSISPITTTVVGVSEVGDSASPQGAFLANSGGRDKEYRGMGMAVQMNPGAASSSISGTTTNTGNNQPINNMQPSQAINYIIALEGIFPSRS